MKSSRILLTVATACLLSYATDVLAQARPGGAPPTAPAGGGGQKAGKEADLLPNDPVIVKKTGTFNGVAVNYTTELGWIPIREDGKVVAKMFYMYYSKNDVTDTSKRPLMLSFNGGPGTASVWMHLGFTGPRHVTYDEDGFQQKPPAGLEDNPHSILDVSDIVYVDTIGTGFSRMVEGEDLIFGLLDSIT